MNNKLLIAILGVVIVGGLIFGIYTVTNTSNTTSSTTEQTDESPALNNPTTSSSPSTTTTTTTVSTAELAKNNGKNGNDCWVAINGKVYDVTGQDEWVNGSHTPSNGQAQCGRDESSSIGSSPHGSSVLSNLPVVGTLAN